MDKANAVQSRAQVNSKKTKNGSTYKRIVKVFMSAWEEL